MTTTGTVNGPQLLSLPDKMDSQFTEATSAAPAILSLPLSAPPIAGVATTAVTSLLDAPPVATSAPPPMERSVIVAFFVSAPPRLSPRHHPGASNGARTLSLPLWRTVGILSFADSVDAAFLAIDSAMAAHVGLWSPTPTAAPIRTPEKSSFPFMCYPPSPSRLKLWVGTHYIRRHQAPCGCTPSIVRLRCVTRATASGTAVLSAPTSPKPADPRAAPPTTARTCVLLPSPNVEMAAERISPRPAPALKEKKFNLQWHSKTVAQRSVVTVPETLAPAQPAVAPAAPEFPIAAPRSGKQKTDSRPVVAAIPRAPARNTTADRTQVPTSESPRTTFAEAMRDVNANHDILVCGDFIAKHTASGYDIDLLRGTRLLSDLKELKLSLLKIPDTPTPGHLSRPFLCSLPSTLKMAGHRQQPRHLPQSAQPYLTTIQHLTRIYLLSGTAIFACWPVIASLVDHADSSKLYVNSKRLPNATFRNSLPTAGLPYAAPRLQPATAVALREDVSLEQLAEGASDVFIPQPAQHDSWCYTRAHPVPEPIGMDSPFTLPELEPALNKASTRSAVGPDNVTIWQLRNLPMALKETVHAEINQGAGLWVHPSRLVALNPVKSMLHARLQWWLEGHQLLSPAQYGFLPGLSTQDVLCMLQHDMLSASSPHLRIMAGVDVRKAFDSVPHSSSGIQLCCCIPRGSHFFLSHRHSSRTYPSQLFKIVIAGVPSRLGEVPDLKHAIYADDITLWTHSGSPGYQQVTIQAEVRIVHSYVQSVGVAPNPDKTEFIVIHGGRRTPAEEAEKQCIELTLAGTPISRRMSIGILGFYLDEHSRAATWLQRAMRTAKQTSHLLPGVAYRSRGVHERDVRIVAGAFVVSRIMYGYPYNRLTRTQQLRLKRSNRKLQRLVTGLPRYTSTEEITSCNEMNNLEDLASAHIAAQETRLRATPKRKPAATTLLDAICTLFRFAPYRCRFSTLTWPLTTTAPHRLSARLGAMLTATDEAPKFFRLP
ncbi:hypothetical protein HPB47_023967, partial [Ixodes persulcatus]